MTLENPGIAADGHAVLVENLVKTYSARHAVDGISFSVNRGEIFAVLGPNGAGKTTTVEILEGYRRADSGTVRVLGLDPSRQGHELKPRIGAMLQESGFYLTLTPRQALTLFATFYREPRDPDDLLATVGLEDSAQTRYRRLSGGQKRRLALALALIGRPELIFLDEPTSGMDPEARRATWDVLRHRRSEGATILLTTHYLEEAERLADRVAILDAGKIIALGAPADLVERDASSLRVRTASAVPIDALGHLPSVTAAREDGSQLYVLETTRPADALVEVATCLRDLGIRARELRVGAESLEDAFLRLTGKRLEQ